MAAAPDMNARSASNALTDAAEFLERVVERADTTKYCSKRLALWVNPDETKGAEYTTARDSIISDVVQSSKLYLPGLEKKQKYYREMLGVFMASVEVAARRWALDDLRNQVPKLVDLLLAAKSNDVARSPRHMCKRPPRIMCFRS
jgi:hypothetical protein